MSRALALALTFGLVAHAPVAGAQTAAGPTPPPDAGGPAAAWTWTLEGNAFGGYNRQDRKFTDFDAWESQNWLMATAARRDGPWTMTLVAGGSLEPFTVSDIGSPQVFQTGETFHNAPLIDYQHPHDLIMNLGADVSRRVGAATISGGAALVGAPPLGPPAFMHRASAIENPQLPLGHHNLDATHITHGVVQAAVELRGLRVGAGRFRGQEPDEQRTDLDLGRLDSTAVQMAYTRARWSGQVSTAWLTRPERLSTYDTTRRTASLSYTAADGGRSLAWTIAAGQNREVHGNLEAYLAEAVLRPSRRWAAYSRAELVDKDILDAGFHPVGVGHRHRQSRVGALTLGGVLDLLTGAFGRVGVGSDLTVYRVPANLRDAYGVPRSARVFLRYYGRFGTPTAPAHHH